MIMKTDNLGIPRFTNKDLIDMIYTGHIDKCHVVLCDPSDDIDKFNVHAKETGNPQLKRYIPIDVNKKDFDGVCQGEWFMPEEYKELNILNWLEAKLMEKMQSTNSANVLLSKEWVRVQKEFEEFKKRGMLDLLKYMVYLVDFMKKNEIVWGVGRGSSVASYILYLIGVHKIDSIHFDLDYREFLR